MSRSAARILTAMALATLALASSSPSRSGTNLLEALVDIPLPGPAGRFDYQNVDTVSNRLYVSHMSAGELLAFDLAARRVEGVVPDLPRVTGVWAVPGLGKVYASVPGRHQVAVIEARTLRVVARLGRIGFPDGIAYAPDQKKIYVSDESGGGELVIDGRTNRVLTNIPLGGEAGNTIFDPRSGRILVAVQTRNEIAEIDPGTDRVAARHKLPGAAGPHGMSLDPNLRLLFVANEGNATLLIVDLRTMRVVERHRVGEDPDVLAYDPIWRRLYVASESGVLSILVVRNRRLESEGHLVLPHAHTVAVDSRTHLVYLPLQDVRGHPVLRILRAP